MANSAKKINTESKYRTVAIVTAPFIIVGGICIGFGWKYVSGAWNKRVDRTRNLPRSMSMAAIHGGKLALDRLVGYQNIRAEQPTQDVDDINRLETLVQNEQPNFKEIQQVLGRLEMGRREDEAIKLLKKALKKAQKKGKPNEAYEIGMLLAEMFIYKGDVQKALKCKCLTEEGVSDARPSLYKAIISLMDQKEEEALQHWQNFKETQNQTTLPSFNEDEFTQFRNAVNLLKQDIDSATQPKTH
ncbi:hypothetical protein like AT2G34530 [Hibiscus trionum]|uniref:Uncharacterized protein n=1 Tax=Hibiscus trionum TaxID=183268 RepID=A0A9W7JFA9_HIBTR|nr:hypothetical protein like AT2G34530 [Hibiscus trionum]